MVVLWLAGVAAAKSPEFVDPGEFYGHWDGWSGTAFTQPKGAVKLHPFLRSAVGVTDNFDVKISPLGSLISPHVGAEYAFVQNDVFAASLEGRARVPWNFRYVDIGIVPHVSFKIGPRLIVDGSLGIHGNAGDPTKPDLDTATTTAGTQLVVNALLPKKGLNVIRPEVSLDAGLSDSTWFVLTMRSDVYGWATNNNPQGVLGSYFVHGQKGFGISAGLNLALLGLAGLNRDIISLEEGVGVQLLPNFPAALPIPLPHLSMWFRL